MDIYRQLRKMPRTFRELPEDIRSDWLYQKYAVACHPMNLEHCVNASKNITLDALKETPDAAEFIPTDLANDKDLKDILLKHAQIQDATRYITHRDDYEWSPVWLANDYAVAPRLDDISSENLFNARIPSGRMPFIQEKMKEYEHPRMEDKYLYMPHIFYRATN